MCGRLDGVLSNHTVTLSYNHGMWRVIGVQGLAYAMVGTSHDDGKFHFKAPQYGSFRAGFRRTPIEVLDVREGDPGLQFEVSR